MCRNRNRRRRESKRSIVRSSDVYLRSLTSRSSAAIASNSVRGPSWRVHALPGSLPKAVLNICARKRERRSVRSPAADDQVDVRMLRVEMRHGDPLQRSPEVPLRLLDDVAGQPLEVESFTELGRDDDLPKTLVTGFLPFAQRVGDIDIATGVTEARMARILSGAFPGDVHSMSAPLAFRPVRRVGHANRTALVERPTACSEHPELAVCWRRFPAARQSSARSGRRS